MHKEAAARLGKGSLAEGEETKGKPVKYVIAVTTRVKKRQNALKYALLISPVGRATILSISKTLGTMLHVRWA